MHYHQPDVPETNFGKLREALQVAEAALSDIGDADREPGDDLAWCERRAAQNLPLIRQALALPTADHIPDAGEMVVDHLPDAGKMIETAAPDMPLSMNQFGRLVELTREHLTDNTFVYKATSKAGDTCHFGVESAAKAWAKGGTVEAIKVREFKLHTSSPTAAPVGERDALDAARYRWLADCNNYEAGLALIIDPKLTEQALGAAIDAAILVRGEVDPLTRYRVWSDGTVQEGAESPYAWMSDDFEYVDATDEEQAALSAAMRKAKP
jgi:hypothetical protein